jgi:dipeptidase E
VKLLLASGGINNESIRNALIELLGKPIAESRALFIPSATHAIPGSPQLVRNGVVGALSEPLGDLGWKSIGVLELTALSSLKREVWWPSLENADALLVQGGDCQYLFGWMEKSGLAALLPELLKKLVYVGQSAGSMIMTSYGTTYGHHNLPPETGTCFGFLDFAILPHLDHEMFPNNSLANLEELASGLSMPTYLIDDDTALKIAGAGRVEVISEGHWKLVTKNAAAT